MKLWLLRHARVTLEPGLCYGASDVPADAGLTRQAAESAAALLPTGLAVRVSGLARAQQLARELTARFHGAEAAQQAEANFERVFSQHELPEEMPEFTLPASAEGIWLPKLLAETEMVKGTGEARRMIQQGAVTVNGEKAGDVEQIVAAQGELILKVGKRRFCKVIFV